MSDDIEIIENAHIVNPNDIALCVNAALEGKKPEKDIQITFGPLEAKRLLVTWGCFQPIGVVMKIGQHPLLILKGTSAGQQVYAVVPYDAKNPDKVERMLLSHKPISSE